MSADEAVDLFNNVQKRPPELRLWAEVLSEGFWDWLAYECLGEEWCANRVANRVANNDARFKHFERKCRRWFQSDRTDAGSFLFCCQHLEIDPAAVRNRLDSLSSRIAAMTQKERVSFFDEYSLAQAFGGGRQRKARRIKGRKSDPDLRIVEASKRTEPEKKVDDMAKIITCAKCGQEREHRALGLCADCYRNDPEVKERKAAWMREYQRKKREAKEAANEPEGSRQEPRTVPAPALAPESGPEFRGTRLVIDFSTCKDVLEKIAAIALDLDRSPEQQARFILRRALRAGKRTKAAGE